MSDNPDIEGGGNAAPIARDQLRAFVERIERLEEEKKAISTDIREVYAELKGSGFDPKIVRQVVRARKMDRDERDNQRALFEMYGTALGIFG